MQQHHLTRLARVGLWRDQESTGHPNKSSLDCSLGRRYQTPVNAAVSNEERTLSRTSTDDLLVSAGEPIRYPQLPPQMLMAVVPELSYPVALENT